MMIKTILLKGCFCIIFLLTLCQGQASSACYGTDPACDYYSLQCPSSQVIRLYNLFAGYKSEPVCGTSSNNHCSYSSLCCSYKTGDVYEIFILENTYFTYTNCSGKQFCHMVQASGQIMQSLLPNAISSTYVQIEYGCETVSSQIPLCGGETGSVTGIYSTAQIMFDGSIEKFYPAKATKECKCTVENIGQNVVFRTIDVRLESYFKSRNQSVAACSSAVLSIGNVLGLQCVETSHHYDVNFYYNNYTNNNQKTVRLYDAQTFEIMLTNIHKDGEYDTPAMVWISLQAEVNKNIRVTCEEVIRAKTATATSVVQMTSTTTGSISPNLTYSSETVVTSKTTTSVVKNNSTSISSITGSTAAPSTSVIKTYENSSITGPTSTTSSEPISLSTSTTTKTPTQQASNQADNSSLVAVKVGIVVGTALLSSVITAGIIFIVLWFRRQNNKRKLGQTANNSEPSAYENFAEVSNAEVLNQPNGNSHVVGDYQGLLDRSQNINRERSAAYDQLHVSQGVYLELSERPPSENQYADIIQQ